MDWLRVMLKRAYAHKKFLKIQLGFNKSEKKSTFFKKNEKDSTRCSNPKLAYIRF